MDASISITVGKGSINHNSRSFIATNVDKDRVQLNHVYANKNIKEAYHDLFDDALEKYNNKQTRSDRIIHNYYEKIRTGKQEKLFHEIIVQVGNKDNMNCLSHNGQIAEKILDQYMKEFTERNPYLYVFSSYLHMDEETPHLHIDFIPFTTNSKRGLETRVSLKQALANQGFKGGSRSETEMQQWINSEKEHLSKIMEIHDIHWEKLNTHNEHLSVLNYKKQKRTEEIEQLENKVYELEKRIDSIKYDEIKVNSYVKTIDSQELWSIPEPKRFTSAQSYKNEIVVPFINKIKSTMFKIVNSYIDLVKEVGNLRGSLFPLRIKIRELEDRNNKLHDENRYYKSLLNKLRKNIGSKLFDELLSKENKKDKKKVR